MKPRLIEALEYVQACLMLARSEFERGNDDAAVVELRKAADRLGEVVSGARA